MTKADKIYKVKCTYDMSSKNITFGMMPIRWVLENKVFEKWILLTKLLSIVINMTFTAIRIWFTSIHRQKHRHQEFVFWIHEVAKWKPFVLEIVLHSALKSLKTVSTGACGEWIHRFTYSIYTIFRCSTIRYLCSIMCCHGQRLEEHIPNYRRWRLSSWSNHFPWIHTRRQCIAIGIRGIQIHRKLRRHFPM